MTTFIWEREPGNSTILNISIRNTGSAPLSACHVFVRYTQGDLWFPQQSTSEDFAAPNGLLLGVEGNNPFTLPSNQTAVLRFAVSGIAALRLEFEAEICPEIAYQLFNTPVLVQKATPPAMPVQQERRWVLTYGPNPGDRFEFDPRTYPAWINVQLVFSVESEFVYDGLRFLSNGVQVGNWSGSYDEMLLLQADLHAGSRQLKLIYAKDEGASAGEDRARIHSIQFLTCEGEAFSADLSTFPAYLQTEGDADWTVEDGALVSPETLGDNQSATIVWNLTLASEEVA